MKRLLCLVSSVILAASLCCPVYGDNINQINGSGNNLNFYDVPSDYWARDQIMSFSQRGIVNGYEDGSFRPEAGVTREEFCKLLVATFQPGLTAPDTQTFSDVDSLRWSYLYVEACKEFMTGYGNPFGGLPAFHPEEYAVREDIAVALVKMIGYKDADAADPNYVFKKFSDATSISPALVPYVSLAVEKNLISGYPDGTFGPSMGITRAETVVMLNRATKQAVSEIESELELTASVAYEDGGKTAVISVYSEQGADISISGDGISETKIGEEVGTYTYTFEAEGEKDFIVTASKSGKTKTTVVNAKYILGAPVLNITECPETSDTTSATIRGTVKDERDNFPSLSVNGKSVDVNYSGDWVTTVKLNEGENTVTIVATNDSGKSTTETRIIRFGVGAPIITITQCPEVSDTTSVTIRGKVKDINDSFPDVTVNGKSVDVNYSGDWSVTVYLKEGDNTITIIATNDLGKTTTETRTIQFGVGAPVLTITQCPESSDTTSVTVRGKVKDINDSFPDVTVNGKSVDVNYSGDWSATVYLKEGDNTITVIATNDLGKTTTETRIVRFGVEAPVLTITQCPSASETDTLTIRGKVKDINDPYPDVTVNGKSIDVNYSGDWSATVYLEEGENIITVTATNDLGKTTTETRTVTFDVGSPEITFTNCPETTRQSNLSIQGRIKGNITGIKLYINDSEVTAVDYDGTFSKRVQLEEGKNVFEIRAVNYYGKTDEVVKTIEYIED